MGLIQGYMAGLFDLGTNNLSGVKDYAGNNQLLPGLPLAQGATPVLVVPDGTIATNGVLTLGTTITTTYAEAWVYFPEGAMLLGVAPHQTNAPAGLYYAKFSNGTTAQIYTNYLEVPALVRSLAKPASLVAAVGSNSAYTQTISEISLLKALIPGGYMGLNGKLSVSALFKTPTSGNAKIIKILIGTQEIFNLSNTTVVTWQVVKEVCNRGNHKIQVCTPLATYGPGSGSGAPLYLTLDTLSDQYLYIAVTKSTATEYLNVEMLSLLLYQG